MQPDRQRAANTQTKPTDLAAKFAGPHLPSPFISITQCEN